MKKAIVALFVFAFAFASLADDPRRPHRNRRHPRNRGPVIVRPIPRPMPRPQMRPCQVVMTDRVNRVVRRYHAWTDYNGMCREGLRQCNWDLNRMGMWGYRCATVRW